MILFACPYKIKFPNTNLRRPIPKPEIPGPFLHLKPRPSTNNGCKQGGWVLRISICLDSDPPDYGSLILRGIYSQRGILPNRPSPLSSGPNHQFIEPAATRRLTQTSAMKGNHVKRSCPGGMSHESHCHAVCQCLSAAIWAWYASHSQEPWCMSHCHSNPKIWLPELWLNEFVASSSMGSQTWKKCIFFFPCETLWDSSNPRWITEVSFAPNYNSVWPQLFVRQHVPSNRCRWGYHQLPAASFATSDVWISESNPRFHLDGVEVCCCLSILSCDGSLDMIAALFAPKKHLSLTRLPSAWGHEDLSQTMLRRRNESQTIGERNSWQHSWQNMVFANSWPW